MDLISSDEESDPQPEHRQHTQISAHSGQHEPPRSKISTKVNNQSTIMFAFPTLFHQFITISKISQNLLYADTTIEEYYIYADSLFTP